MKPIRKTARKKIPPKVAAEVEYLSNGKCCVCQKPDVHIHHLDDDPSNSKLENLALLCLTCHHKATVKGGLARKLSPETIRRYRKEHYEQIERTRKTQKLFKEESQSNEHFETLVQAVEVSEIRKIGRQLKFCDFEDARALLSKLHYYWLCGDQTKLAVLEAVSGIAQKARQGLTSELSNTIHGIASNVLPPRNSWPFQKRKLQPKDEAMFERAEQFGFVMAYDGALYLKNLSIVNDGGFFLWAALRVGHGYNCKKLIKNSSRDFGTSINAAERGNFPEARRLLINLRNQATQKDILYPELEHDLAEIIYPQLKRH